MNRSGEEQERLLALLEEEAQRTHSDKSHKDQREGLTAFNHTNLICILLERQLSNTGARESIVRCKVQEKVRGVSCRRGIYTSH